MFKTGYITVVGKPNAGKSTLVNKLVGYKVAITTPKPQTTRFNIKGIITTNTAQMIYIDTPGIHAPKNKMGIYMMKGVQNSLKAVDIVVYMVDSTKPRVDDVSQEIIKNLVNSKAKIILCINKIDKIKKVRILEIIQMYNSHIQELGAKYMEIIPISVYKDDGLDVLVQNIEKYLPEGEPIYSEDDITDITEKDIIQEMIREKALNNLEEEVPHGIMVEVQKFKKRKNKEKESIYDIEVDIVCEKMSHKGIIIGKDGLMLKKIGSQARHEIEKMLDDKVNLKIWVKVRPHWQQSEIYLKDIKNKIK